MLADRDPPHVPRPDGDRGELLEPSCAGSEHMEPGDRLATLGREVLGADVSLDIDQLPSHGRGTQPRTVRAFRAPPLGPWTVPRGRSTKSAASSASLRSVLRVEPIFARMVKPWA